MEYSTLVSLCGAMWLGVSEKMLRIASEELRTRKQNIAKKTCGVPGSWGFIRFPVEIYVPFLGFDVGFSITYSYIFAVRRKRVTLAHSNLFPCLG